MSDKKMLDKKEVVFYSYFHFREQKGWKEYDLVLGETLFRSDEHALREPPLSQGKVDDLFRRALFGSSHSSYGLFAKNLDEIIPFLEYHYEAFLKNYPEHGDWFLDHTRSLVLNFRYPPDAALINRNNLPDDGAKEIKKIVKKWVKKKRASMQDDSEEELADNDNIITITKRKRTDNNKPALQRDSLLLLFWHLKSQKAFISDIPLQDLIACFEVLTSFSAKQAKKFLNKPQIETDIENPESFDKIIVFLEKIISKLKEQKKNKGH